MDSAKEGVIYVSWGSIIRAETLPEDKRNAFIDAFGSVKQKVFWKWENETLPNKPKNVYIRPWLPQRDILCHPNVRLFVSHGGLLGSSEAAHCGVPMLLTPMYGDQFLNSKAIESRGMGTIVHYEDLTVQSIKAALKETLTEEKLLKAKQVSYDYTHRPMAAIDTAVWWVEHVHATGGLPLADTSAKYLPIITYYQWDIYATFAVVIFISVLTWVFILYKLFKRKSANGKSKTQ